MAKLGRRDFLLIVAAGVGTAAALGSEDIVGPSSPSVALPAAGDVEDAVSGAGGGGSTTPGETFFETAATLAGVPEASVDAQIEFVTGDNRDFGVHVTYDGSLPITAEGDGYEVAIVDSVGSEPNPRIFPQFIFVPGNARGYGVHIKRENATGQFQQEDDFTLAFADTLGSMPDPNIFPQYEFVTGDNRDYGTHVRTN